MDWLDNAIDKAHESAVKRKAYSDYPLMDVVDKLNEELSELMDAIHDEKHSDPWAYLGEDMIDNSVKPFESHMKNGIEDELADLFIVIMAASKELGFNLRFAVDCKQEYNRKRED